MRARHFVGLAGLAAVGALVAAANAQAPGARGPTQCTPASIGLARTIEIDTRGAPRFGQNQYPGQSPLKDREVILTFDDGPHKTLTQPVLDALDAHCTKATFFMVGQRALFYPEIVRRVAGRAGSWGTVRRVWAARGVSVWSSVACRSSSATNSSAVANRPAGSFASSRARMSASQRGGGSVNGGGGSSVATCGTLSMTTSLTSLGAPQVSGTTDKTCDGLTGLVIRFTDLSPSADCTLTIPNFNGATYFKYGVRPPSRYASAIFASGSCSSTSHVLSGSLSLNGVDLGSAATIWVAP